MNARGEKVSHLAADLIEEQLHTLPVSIAALLEVFEVDADESALLAKLVLERKPRVKRTGSGGNIVAAEVHPHPPLNFQTAAADLQARPLQKFDHLRVLTGNALLAVAFFLRERDMLSMRTPEIQFLGHAVAAIMNGNVLKVAPGHMPTAAFDGLVIDVSVNGKALFDSHQASGLMAIGDGIALLQWLSRYFRGEEAYVSGGDAG